ncbi:MAG: DNA mismatch repair protein MutS [Clostridiaceae bacterium]|nr:DNA mismatch repair protein MutS [Clostridiaceae bacterium]
MAELSPMMKQYFEIKKDYPDTILMFRLGDFYEMFFEDAKLVSRELELVLTGRDCGQEERAPMCGVPFHSADGYIAKLVSKGYKVAICEQVEDPKTAKGIVKREVIRVISAGTVIESSMLDETRNNYLAVVCSTSESVGVCFVDVSTGSVNLTELTDNYDERLVDELSRFMPSELLINKEAATLKRFSAFIAKKLDTTAQVLSADSFDFDTAKKTVLNHFKCESLEKLDLENKQSAVCALGAALAYLYEAQKNELDNIKKIDFYTDAKYMKIGLSTRRNLEITETMREREKRGSLLWVLDKTKTAMGKRLIRNWLECPLYDCAMISKRHNAVQELYDGTVLRDELTGLMVDIYDMERLMTRVLYNTANAKELLSLKTTLAPLPRIKELTGACKSALLKEIHGDIDLLEDVYNLVDESIDENAPFSVREGGMIKSGFNAELDELRNIVHGGRDFLNELELKEQESTGIKKLKIKYNKVFGYFIEVPNAYKEIVPENYIRKQTLVNCERYITEELKELETKVLGAQERIVSLEYEIFSSIRKKIGEQFDRTSRTSKAIAALDTLCSLASVAVANNYTRPDINNTDEIIIKDGRHPVIEKMLKDMPFVPNDTTLDCKENRIAIITGPNMAGKSTYMRQVAIITMMAQMGSFVPASYASIGLVDSVFTRVGASDDLASGQSTFMVEMSEVAEILENATNKSLIILDEIGRGTSTFDGMSIAKAVIEYIADNKKIGAKTLFATHYHELTELENELKCIKNYNIAVKKRGEDIIFLRRIVRGGASSSYGIDVARLAGVPDTVVRRAKVILKSLEDGDSVYQPRAKSDYDTEQELLQMSFSSSNSDEIAKELRELDVNTLTPIEAMTKLFELANKAHKGE